MKEFLNPDGETYNGLAALASLTGLSEDEIEWAWLRIKELTFSKEYDKEEVQEIIARERILKPWLSNNGEPHAIYPE